MVVGGWRREEQTFSLRAAEANAGLLSIAVAAMLCPAIFHFSAERMHDIHLEQHEWGVSLCTGIVLLVVYGFGLLFTLRTHSHLFCTGPRDAPCRRAPSRASSRASSSCSWRPAGIALVGELLVGSAAAVADSFGWNPVFVGVILLAIVGNAAEHTTAVQLARADDMETAMTITYQSSLQIALFVTPVLVFTSAALVALGFENRHAPRSGVHAPRGGVGDAHHVHGGRADDGRPHELVRGRAPPGALPDPRHLVLLRPGRAVLSTCVARAAAP